MKSYATLRTQRVGKRKTTAYFNLSTLNFNDMKKKPGKYLRFYYECAKTGRVYGDSGLCSAFDNDSEGDIYDYVEYPLFEEMFFPDLPIGEWIGPKGEFNELRQTIVLFMAAMNNEL